MNKKLLSIIAAGMLCVSLAACGGGGSGTTEQTQAPAETTQAVVGTNDLKPEVKATLVGTFNVTPEWLPFENAVVVDSIMEGEVLPVGDTYYHLYEEKVSAYKIENGKLKLQKEKTFDDDYEKISAGKDGMIYLSPGIGTVVGVKDLEPAMSTTVKGDLVMHPSQNWGLTFWVGSDTQKVTITDGIAKAEPWILTGMNDSAKRKGYFNMISSISISENHIMVAGNMADDSGQKVVIYDLNGKEKFKLGGNNISDPDKLGSVSGMVETKNGFVAADGNMKGLFFWNTKGEFIGEISIPEFLGLDGAWLQSIYAQEDGSLIVAVGADRADDKEELVIFKLTGF